MDRDVTYSVALLRFSVKSYGSIYNSLCVAVVTLWATPTCGVGVSGGSGIGGLVGTDVPEWGQGA